MNVKKGNLILRFIFSDTRGVLVLLVSVQILVHLDCFSYSITMEVWKPARWKTAKFHRNEHTQNNLLNTEP